MSESNITALFAITLFVLLYVYANDINNMCICIEHKECECKQSCILSWAW